MSDALERQLEEMDHAVGEEIKTIMNDACDRMGLEPEDIAMRMDKTGGIHVTTREQLKRCGLDG